MKRAIEWVDVVKGNGFGVILPSELLKLVEDVRTEALDAVELALRKMIPNDSDKTLSADALRAAIHEIGTIRDFAE